MITDDRISDAIDRLIELGFTPENIAHSEALMHLISAFISLPNSTMVVAMKNGRFTAKVIENFPFQHYAQG